MINGHQRPGNEQNTEQHECAGEGHYRRRLPPRNDSSLHEAGLVAAIYTPVDTSTLINSQFKEVITNGTCITGPHRIFSKLRNLCGRSEHPAEVHLPRARKEFLQHGVADAKPQMAAAFQRELSKR